jgi:hypothetical protein
MKNIFILLVLPLFLSSCATIMTGKYQAVTIEKTAEQTILIDNAEPKLKKNKYLLRRNGMPKYITIKENGHKDIHIVAIQNKVCP